MCRARCYFCSNEARDKFLEALEKKVQRVHLGSYRDKRSEVGKLTDITHVQWLAKFLLNNHENIKFGGEIDFKQGIVKPTIIVHNIKDG